MYLFVLGLFFPEVKLQCANLPSRVEEKVFACKLANHEVTETDFIMQVHWANFSLLHLAFKFFVTLRLLAEWLF